MLKMAYKSHLTCFNIVNVENSPITQAINQASEEQDKEKPLVLYNSSDDESEVVEKNIGIYQKSGHCYSDVKAFIP